jgi:hypothetical protein
MKEHEAVKIWVVWVEMTCLVQRMVIFYIGADFQGISKAILNYGAKGVARSALREGEFGISVCHTLRTNEDQVERYSREKIGQLNPDFSWKR